MSSDFCAASSSASAVSREIVSYVAPSAGIEPLPEVMRLSCARPDSESKRAPTEWATASASAVSQSGVGSVSGDEIDRVESRARFWVVATPRERSDGPAASHRLTTDLTADEAGSAGDEEAWRGRRDERRHEKAGDEHRLKVPLRQYLQRLRQTSQSTTAEVVNHPHPGRVSALCNPSLGV